MLTEHQQAGSCTTVPASHYTFDQLADLYNQTRIDYIVPMPMNGKRLAEYVHNYDIDLDASAVALNADNLETGLIMMGARDNRSWATRLGVIPERRTHHVGQCLMELLIAEARRRGLGLVQLEVIKGNEPAHRLFLKLGFQPTRELLIIRRPPGKPAADLAPVGATITPIADASIPDYLQQRAPDAAWTEETPSLLHAGGLKGLYIQLSSGETGWIIFQRAPFQLTHFAFNAGASQTMMQALLYSVHQQNAMQDTKIENVPVDHPTWPVFQKLGYLEVFRRTEMYLYL
ncbi:MAG: GNAT family N-acetyltransferase [Anaerolineae bacterium]|nr:GNAT family N-acetyltransferase [Anaerolineae bacterium]